jgi:hypothetical protein
VLIKVSTKKTVKETAVSLETAVKSNHFGVMQVHNLQESMIKKGVEFAQECLIFEVCQPKRGLSAKEGQESARRKYEPFYCAALSNIHLPGGWKNSSGNIEANHAAGDVQGAAIGGSGCGSGGHDCENHERGGRRLIGVTCF